jgi:hypothetical protein
MTVMKISLASMLFFLFVNGVKAQVESTQLDCIKNNQICDYVIENADTIWQQCIEPYYPISNYLGYREDCVELYWLYKYSWVLKSIDEKILYKEKKDFFRILILNARTSKLILLENNNNHYNLTIKKFELDSVLSPELDSKIEYQIEKHSLTEKDYFSLLELLDKSSIQSVKAHPSQYFAFSDYEVVCFESSHRGYTMTDLYIPFIKHVEQFQGLFKFLERAVRQRS